MTRFWIGLLFFAVGCSRTPTLTPSSPPDPGFTEAATKSEPVAEDKNVPPALTVGSPAPALKVGRFLKGEPVTSFEPGKIYVIEFWATWCGPCIKAMPHISELQKQYPDVTFIGVNVWEEEVSEAEELVKKMDAKLEYRIAVDEVSDGNPDHGAMATTWLKAAEINSIPTAIIVDGQGRIADITRPMELDETLPQIIAGKWDAAAAAKRHLNDVLKEREQQ